MSPRGTLSLMRRQPVLQVGLLIAFWLMGEAGVRLLGLPVPGGVVGMGMVLVLLVSRRLSSLAMRRGAEWLLADMLLFFVPAVLAVLEHREFLGLIGLKILFVIVLSTAAVMLVTAFAVDRCYRWKEARAVAASIVR